jgi:menaquinone-dependent protoporphyrinogen oxidase
MSVLIVYRSKYGYTESCCRQLARSIRAESVIVNLASRRVPSPRNFNAVLVGGSIYGGKIEREVASFCDRQAEALRATRVGLFICCLYEGDHAREQLQSAFPGWLTAHAFATGLFGGEIRFDALTLLDKLLVRTVSPSSRDVSHPRPDAIREMADSVNSLAPFR